MAIKVLNARARQVLVLPQPFGTLMLATTLPGNESLLDDGCLSLVIDPGYSTFDWLVSDGASPRMDISGAFAGGVSRLLRAVSRKLSQDHGIDAPELPRVEAALHDGVLNTGARKITMAPYASEPESFLNSSASAILGAMEGEVEIQLASCAFGACHRDLSGAQEADRGVFFHFLPSHAACPAITDAPPPQPMSSGTSAAMRIRLCASTNSPTTARTLASPRTGMRCRPRLRASALTHSAVAARSL